MMDQKKDFVLYCKACEVEWCLSKRDGIQ